jgi:formylmethanofuran dehydrogenase subunit E
MDQLQDLLAKSASMHHHLCPRQVLGVQMGLFAGELLAINLPQKDKRLYAIAELDGCAVDGISVATNCWVGRRTLHIEDYGKLAATFVDTWTGTAVRIAPLPGIRAAALDYAPEVKTKWEGQLMGYQNMPRSLLFHGEAVRLSTPIELIISQPGQKALCEICGEEVMNGREIKSGGNVICRSCAGFSYYQRGAILLEDALPIGTGNDSLDTLAPLIHRLIF